MVFTPEFPHQMIAQGQALPYNPGHYLNEIIAQQSLAGYKAIGKPVGTLLDQHEALSLLERGLKDSFFAITVDHASWLAQQNGKEINFSNISLSQLIDSLEGFVRRDKAQQLACACFDYIFSIAPVEMQEQMKNGLESDALNGVPLAAELYNGLSNGRVYSPFG